MSFYNLEITVVCSIFSASSKPCITSAMMRVAKINPELNASHSVMQGSSLVQSLNFSKVSFCFIVRLEFRSPSFLHINLTSLPPSFLKETVDIINQTIYNVNCDNSCMEAYYDYF